MCPLVYCRPRGFALNQNQRGRGVSPEIMTQSFRWSSNSEEKDNFIIYPRGHSLFGFILLHTLKIVTISFDDSDKMDL